MCLAIPTLVVALLPDHGARVALDGVEKVISTLLVEPVVPGDYVVVHVGYALAKIDKDEAERTLALLAEMGEAS
ncbi:MAG: HypC/HybG/HupF family hydrogenase formation chaperone [Rhodospirillum sp.]|nr:HypC/HybG/HupF family hydrogenase formation chaperone [Rhodospirillum sp.]MCF8489217.1 HypC/HybG/HupF family hydrogenase formation chaperone [Rhodospirillum sp.]MCF8502452.1 HypC/HybG/HupF family hydrogenase formation chaperone [Rhodospirillum sp.]